MIRPFRAECSQRHRAMRQARVSLRANSYSNIGCGIRSVSARSQVAERSRPAAGSGSDPLARMLLQNTFSERPEVTASRGEESRQVTVRSREEFGACRRLHYVRIVEICTPVLVESAPTPLTKQPQALDIQSQDCDSPGHVVGIDLASVASFPIGFYLTVQIHLDDGLKRGQRAGVHELRVVRLTLCLSATEIPFHWLQISSFVANGVGAVKIPRGAAKTTGDHVVAVELFRRSTVRVAARNDMLDLPIRFGEVDFAIAAETALERGETLHQLAVGSTGRVIAESLPAMPRRWYTPQRRRPSLEWDHSAF